MELIPTNPIMVKPQPNKSSVQVLEDFCQKNGLGIPVYRLHSILQCLSGQDEVQLFLFKVSVPALIQNLGPFQPDKLFRTIEEAKIYAAEYTMNQMTILMENVLATQPSTAPSAVQSRLASRPLASSAPDPAYAVPLLPPASDVVAGNILPRAPYDYTQATGGYQY